MPRLIIQRWLGCSILLVAAGLAGCVDSYGLLNGCEITHVSGRWNRGDEGSWEYQPTFNRHQRCPVPLFRAGQEQIHTTAFLTGYIPYDGRDPPPYNAVLEARNSAGVTLARRTFPFTRRFSINQIDTDLELTYTAATGPMDVTRNFDYLDLEIREYCCIVPSHEAAINLKVTYKPSMPLQVIMEGPDVPPAGTTQSWSAYSLSGGHPHSVQWYRDGAPVGTGETYTAATGASDFTLRADMTDVYGGFASGSMPVDVDGIRVSVRGPIRVTAGYGSWTTEARGGYPPYTFTWYEDGVQVGQGSTYSTMYETGGYTVDLSVVARDSRGTPHSAVQPVTIESLDNCGDMIAC